MPSWLPSEFGGDRLRNEPVFDDGRFSRHELQAAWDEYMSQIEARRAKLRAALARATAG